MSRKYYLRCEVTCDKCGFKDDYDIFNTGERENREALDIYIERYYNNVDGKDICEDCFEEISLGGE